MSKEVQISSPLRRDVLPHRVRHKALEFEVAEFSVDDRDGVPVEDDRIVPLAEYGNWEDVEITVSIDVESEVLDYVFAASEDYPGRVLVTGHCVETYLRDSETVAKPPLGEPPYEADLSLKSNQVAESVKLEPYLVYAGDGREPEGFASTPGALLADGRSWDVKISEEGDQSNDLLDISKTSFAEKTDGRFPPESTLYYLDLNYDPDNPILWFNTDHSAVTSMMRESDTEYETATENLVWNDVLANVWTRLVLIAAADYDPEGGSLDREWEEAVMGELSQSLFPDERPSPEKTAERLSEQINGGGVVAATERIERAVQEFLETAAYFENHVEKFRGEV